MTEEQLKSSSNYFKIVFKILLFVSSVLFLSVVASWFVMKNMKIPESPREIKLEKYVSTVKADKEGSCGDLEYRLKQMEVHRGLNHAIIYYTNGDKYEGQISEENVTINSVSRYLEQPKLPHGWGEMKYSDDRRYRGQWVRGDREGCGELISPGSLATTFSGHWLQDKQTGWGLIYYSNGAAFKVNNLYHGEGTLSWSNGDSYTGNFSYGSMHGRGLFLYRDGTRYSGTWAEGQITGRGSLQTSSGKCFSVVWQDFRPNIYIDKHCSSYNTNT